MIVKRIGDHYFSIPSQAKTGDAGYDLISVEKAIIKVGELKLIPTGFAWEIAPDWVGIIKPRSGMSTIKRLTTDAGVIDSSYRGQVFVALVNNGPAPQLVEAGERIAQMVVVPHYSGRLIEEKSLTDTARNTDGFGSTGE